MQANLIELFMRAEFQIEILKYGFTAKVGFYSEKSLKMFDLLRNKLEARTIFTVDIVH